MAKKTPQRGTPARRATGGVAKKAAAGGARPAAKSTGHTSGRRGGTPAGVSDSGNKAYLIGAVATLGGGIVLFILMTLMGGTPKVKDRFANLGNATTSTVTRDTTSRNTRGDTSMGPSMANRNVGRQSGEDDQGLEDRQRAAAESMVGGRQGWDITQIRVTMGEPEEVVENYLNELRDKDKVERFDKVKRLEVEHDSGREVVLYYVVNPWDLMKGPPHKAPRELLRFSFSPSDANVRALRDELENMPRDAAFKIQRETLEQQIREMSGSNTYQLSRFERVTHRDTDYARYMPR